MVAELRHLAQRVQKCCDAMKMEEERYEEVRMGWGGGGGGKRALWRLVCLSQYCPSTVTNLYKGVVDHVCVLIKLFELLVLLHHLLF